MYFNKDNINLIEKKKRKGKIILQLPGGGRPIPHVMSRSGKHNKWRDNFKNYMTKKPERKKTSNLKT